MKKVVKYAAGVAALVVAALAGAAAYSFYSFEHTPPLTSARPQDILIALQGSMGETLFGVSNPLPRGVGLITAYQRDPQTFRRYATLFDTVSTAMRIGKFVRQHQQSLRLPLVSTGLPLPAAGLLDPWHHPYCVTRLQNALVIVSGGPKARSFSCRAQHFRVQQISSVRRRVFQTPAGEVVLILAPPSQRSPPPPPER